MLKRCQVASPQSRVDLQAIGRKYINLLPLFEKVHVFFVNNWQRHCLAMDVESSSVIFSTLRLAQQEHSKGSVVLMTLRDLTSRFRGDAFRNGVSAEDVSLLVDIFDEYSGEVVAEGLSFSPAIEVSTECVRCLRNACVQCAKNQDAIASPPLVESIRKLMAYILEKPNPEESEWILLRCCIQCLNNIASGHAEGQVFVWSHVLASLMPSILGVRDGKAVQYSCMLLQTCLSNSECAAEFEGSPDTACVMESILSVCSLETDQDFSLQLVQRTLQLPTLIAKVLGNLTLPSQIVLVDIAHACIAEEAEGQHISDALDQGISEGTLKCFAEKFSCMGHHILSLAMRDRDSDQNPRLVTSFLDLLCTASARPSLRSRLQNMETILETSLELLDMVEQVGRSSDNVFTVSQDFSGGPSGDCAGRETPPGHGFKRGLVQLLGNLCFRHRPNQDRVRELNGIPSILQQCNVDSRNAFINQWAILAVRNLCEDNPENQAYIASLRNQGVADNETLARLGFEAVLRDDGQVYLRNVKQK